MLTHRRVVRTAILAAVAAGLLVGCSSSGEDAPGQDPSGESFEEMAAQARADAVEDRASETQLAAIDAAIAEGEMTVAHLLIARDAFAQCLDGTGFTLVDGGVVKRDGFPYPEFTIASPPDDESTTLMDECERLHYGHADLLYQRQPVSLAAQDAEFARKMPSLVACLEGNGVAVDAEATADEVKQAMLEYMQNNAPQPGDPGVEVHADGSMTGAFDDSGMMAVMDCLHENDIGGF